MHLQGAKGQSGEGGGLLFLTQQQELALVSVEPQELAAEVLDVGRQAVLPEQHGKVLQLQRTQPLPQLREQEKKKKSSFSKLRTTQLKVKVTNDSMTLSLFLLQGRSRGHSR